MEAAKAKLYAAEVAMEVTTKAVQLHGGYEMCIRDRYMAVRTAWGVSINPNVFINTMLGRIQTGIKS